jgi:FtsP/CotA-like multicopper oxidase with cupredoxin domain
MRWPTLLLCAAGVCAQPLTSPPDAPDLEPAADVVRVELRAGRYAEPRGTFLYGYNELNPGPVIRTRLGDTLVAEVHNDLDAGTTVHWHGVAAPWEMDGVTWMGAPVEAGEQALYTFAVERAGTFWYHPHFNTEQQVDAGLYGVVVVEDPAEPAADAELVVVLDTESEHHDPAPRHGHGRATSRPRWLVNGQPAPATYRAAGGSAVRVRFLNASNVAFAALRWPNLRQIAGEQGLLPSLQTPERVVLGPGQRAEFEWLVGEEGFAVSTDLYTLNGGDALGDPMTLIDVEVEAPAPAPAGLAWPFPGGEPTADEGQADVVYALAGSDRTGEWRINGEKFPDVTIAEFALGQAVIVDVRNLSPTEHPFHMHGHHFEVLSVNGEPPPYKVVADTWNVRIRDQVRLRFVADNPGDWMTHCHILPHVGGGMMTVLRVLDE